MNSTALQIYSFFMRTNLQFVRYCHPAYTNRNQWKSLLKKSKLEATMPVCSVIPHESGYALYLHPVRNRLKIGVQIERTLILGIKQQPQR